MLLANIQIELLYGLRPNNKEVKHIALRKSNLNPGPATFICKTIHFGLVGLFPLSMSMAYY